MSNHDKRKRSRKIFDAIKGESAGDVREFYESKFRDLLAKDDTLMKRALRLNMDVVGTGNKDPLVFLIHEMTQQALDDVRTGVNLKAENARWLSQIADSVISLYEKPAPWMEESPPESLRISFASDLTDNQLEGALLAVANYYRACGGAGLKVEFNSIEVPPSKFGVV